MSVFSERLRELRKARRVPQNELAESVGVGLRAYRHYETGDREPKMATLIALADYFGVTLDYLVGRTDEEEA